VSSCERYTQPPHAGIPPPVCCPWLLIQYIGSYPPYWKSLHQQQPEDVPCCGDRTHISRLIFLYLLPPKHLILEAWKWNTDQNPWSKSPQKSVTSIFYPLVLSIQICVFFYATNFGDRYPDTRRKITIILKKHNNEYMVPGMLHFGDSSQTHLPMPRDTLVDAKKHDKMT